METLIRQIGNSINRKDTIGEILQLIPSFTDNYLADEINYFTKKFMIDISDLKTFKTDRKKYLNLWKNNETRFKNVIILLKGLNRLDDASLINFLVQYRNDYSNQKYFSHLPDELQILILEKTNDILRFNDVNTKYKNMTGEIVNKRLKTIEVTKELITDKKILYDIFFLPYLLEKIKGGLSRTVDEIIVYKLFIKGKKYGGEYHGDISISGDIFYCGGPSVSRGSEEEGDTEGFLVKASGISERRFVDIRSYKLHFIVETEPIKISNGKILGNYHVKFTLIDESYTGHPRTESGSISNIDGKIISNDDDNPEKTTIFNREQNSSGTIDFVFNEDEHNRHVPGRYEFSYTGGLDDVRTEYFADQTVYT